MHPITWSFPLPRVHTGIPLANGRMGALVWGEGTELHVTVGHAAHWDHRGGGAFPEDLDFGAMRRLLEAGRESELRARFAETAGSSAGKRDRPTMLPVGRLDWRLAGTLVGARFEPAHGRLALETTAGAWSLAIDPEAERLVLMGPGASAVQTWTPVPAWRWVEAALAARGFVPPEPVEGADEAGWVQPSPNDPAIAVLVTAPEPGAAAPCAWQVTMGRDTPEASLEAARGLARRSPAQTVFERAAAWWAATTARAASLTLPVPHLQRRYELGMSRFAAATHPEGVPLTLQGPWVEEHRLPAWSNDYHFNINVQMCYQPGYHGNLPDHFRPLWEMIHSWTAQLRENARRLAGVEDGRMLPHAVSDDCRFLVGYWGHSVDHGSTAWVAAMMYRHYRYTLDAAFLREIAFPFMLGTMRVYEAMIERGGPERDRLPLGVSPEYFNAEGCGVGPDASFQLACVHRLLEDLGDAAAVLGESLPPAWAEIRRRLPRAALVGPPEQPRIGLWEGQDLEASHRHHSHLAGITPFDVIDPSDPAWAKIVEASFRQWIDRGAGRWSGWCLSWAAALHQRVGNRQASVFWLEAFERFFTNEGGGTLHDARHPGLSLIGAPATTMRQEPEFDDLMQLDGGLGATAVLQESVLQVRRGVNYLFAGTPAAWDEVAGERLRTDGGFLVSVARAGGEVAPVEVTSECGGTFRLMNPWPGRGVRVAGGPALETDARGVATCQIPAGETVRIEPA